MRAVKGEAELAFPCLVIPLGGLPALAQLALLVAHHVEVPLLAVRVPCAVVEHVLKILVDAFYACLLGCFSFGNALTSHPHFALRAGT